MIFRVSVSARFGGGGDGCRDLEAGGCFVDLGW